MVTLPFKIKLVFVELKGSRSALPGKHAYLHAQLEVQWHIISITHNVYVHHHSL